MSELLAPAGDILSARTAIDCGADAVYLGLTSFSARAGAHNFDISELESFAKYAHSLGVKVHVAMNTLVKDGELSDFINCAVAAHNAGADAIIMQDVFLGKFLKQNCPQMTLHLSTQAGVNNVYGARLAEKYGFSRVILARETPFSEIEKIASVIETEVFVQGALCTCFSGQCYLSSFAGGNSGNRGRCKQPCRKLYSIDRAGFENPAYALSPSDLCLGEDIAKFAKAGVYSFKIEGRMRRPEYIAAAVGYYRALLDGIEPQYGLSALKRTYNRGNYTKGLAFGQDKTFLSSAVQGHIGEFCGTVSVVNGKYVCRSSEECGEGDAFKILRSGKEVGGAVYGGRAKGGFILSSNVRLMNGDKAFITTDVALNERLLSRKKLKNIKVAVCVAEGEKLSASIEGREFFSDDAAASAVSRAITKEDVIRSFSKTDSYPFDVEITDVSICGSPFVPVSALNAFRRKAYSEYYKGFSDGISKITDAPALPKAATPQKNGRTAVIACDLRGVRADIGILKPVDYSAIDASLLKGFSGEKFLFLPPFFNGCELEGITEKLKYFDGVYCDGFWAAELCAAVGKKLFAGSGFNIGNSLSLSYVDAEYIALSKELTFSEAAPLARSNTFYLSAGDIKVMDLLYCPFGKSCAKCDRRGVYTLTDESGRAFKLRRYECGRCMFELYNCVPLVAVQRFTGALVDCTLCDSSRVPPISGDESALKNYFKNYTSGHSKTPVL